MNTRYILRFLVVVALSVMTWALFVFFGSKVDKQTSGDSLNVAANANSKVDKRDGVTTLYVSDDATDRNSDVKSRNEYRRQTDELIAKDTLLATDLGNVFQRAITTNTLVGADQAMEILGMCLMYAGSSGKELDAIVSRTFFRRIGNGQLDDRRSAVSKLLKRCNYFSNENVLKQATLSAQSELQKQGGITSWLAVDAKQLDVKERDLLRLYFQHPDQHLSGLRRAAGALIFDITGDQIEASGFVYALSMCQLGSPCGVDSFESLDNCARFSLCGLTVQEGIRVQLQTLGLDAHVVFEQADRVASQMLLGDITPLLSNPKR